MVRLSLAPMVDWTDRHFRWLARRLAPDAFLYTEMITAPAVLRGDRQSLLDHSSEEHPLALQLAGNDPGELEEACAVGLEWGYDEFNLNCGCPSDRVQNAGFGACLMADPDLVARLVRAMVRGAGGRPVTVKHRIGIPGRDRYADMRAFALAVTEAGADRIIVHARIAILEGLDPKRNRSIPPLRYGDVERLKEEFPHWRIEINGGITDLETVRRFAKIFDGVMIGRAAYEDPYFLAAADRLLFPTCSPPPTREELLQGLLTYWRSFEEEGQPPHRLLRHLTGLFHGLPGSRRWKQLISPPWRHSRLEDYLAEALHTLPERSLRSAEYPGALATLTGGER